MSTRLVEAFAAAKERSEAAFVAFVTAGYPEKKGKLFVSSFFSVRNVLFR